ncbi:MAG TPA: hypothetical protein VGY98_01275 [Verrucomicrobiae bacterium]|nr:hypothetical protein [Verrucomicrobiae bacterium]
MKTPKLTKQKIALAFTVAVIADAIQFPMTAATATGVLAVPAEGTDFALDCVVMVITSTLLGFHWLFLPSFVFEIIPGFDLFPTWTGCVAYVVWRRRKNQSEPLIVDAQEVLPPLLRDAQASEDSHSPEKMLSDVQSQTPEK